MLIAAADNGISDAYVALAELAANDKAAAGYLIQGVEARNEKALNNLLELIGYPSFALDQEVRAAKNVWLIFPNSVDGRSVLADVVKSYESIVESWIGKPEILQFAADYLNRFSETKGNEKNLVRTVDYVLNAAKKGDCSWLLTLYVICGYDYPEANKQAKKVWMVHR